MKHNNCARIKLDHSVEIEAFFQPIMHLATGRVAGFEALARLWDRGMLLAPAQFLPSLSETGRIRLFRAMLDQAQRFITTARTLHPSLSVSVNVEWSLMLRDDFCGLVSRIVEPVNRSAICLELLEGEKMDDVEGAIDKLLRLKDMGITISLDDVGSAYSSLLMLKRLPMDVVKLDRQFALELPRRPDDLPFIHSIVTLARGLGKRLIVEGVETSAIQEALAILGAEYGQGYAIAHPMAADQCLRWLEAHQPAVRAPGPQTLLGSYAAHLNVTETCRILALQPLPIDWLEEAKDPHACAIGALFDRLGFHETRFGLAHKNFHQVIDRFQSDQPAWDLASNAFRQELRSAILAEAADPRHAIRCSPANGPEACVCKAS